MLVQFFAEAFEWVDIPLKLSFDYPRGHRNRAVFRDSFPAEVTAWCPPEEWQQGHYRVPVGAHALDSEGQEQHPKGA